MFQSVAILAQALYCAAIATRQMSRKRKRNDSDDSDDESDDPVSAQLDPFAVGVIAALAAEGYTQRQIADHEALDKPDGSSVSFGTVGTTLRRLKAQPGWRGTVRRRTPTQGSSWGLTSPVVCHDGLSWTVSFRSSPAINEDEGDQKHTKSNIGRRLLRLVALYNNESARKWPRAHYLLYLEDAHGCPTRWTCAF